MSIQLSKLRSFLLIAAVVLSNIAVMGEFATFPIVDTLYDQFPDQKFWVDTWMSINQWTIIIFSILGALILRKVSKKTMLIAGAVIFTLSGALGAVESSIVLMVILRALYGIGVAFCNVGAVAVVAEVYTDEDKMNWVMGIYNSLQAAIGAVISALGGVLGTIGWTAPFKLLWSGVIMIVVFIFCIPYIKPEGKAAEHAEKKESAPLGITFWLTTLAFILFAVAYAVPSQYASSYVVENGIGDEAVAGLLGSLGTIGSFVFCLFYERMFRLVNRKVIIIWYLMAAILIAIMFFLPMKGLCYALFLIVGGSMSIACTYTYAIIPSIVAPSRVDDGIGILTAACCAGYAIAPYFTSLIQKLLGTENITPTFIFSAGAALIAALIEIFMPRRQLLKER